MSGGNDGAAVHGRARGGDRDGGRRRQRRATAHRLAADGYAVVIAEYDEERGEAVERELTDDGRAVLHLHGQALQDVRAALEGRPQLGTPLGLADSDRY